MSKAVKLYKLAEKCSNIGRCILNPASLSGYCMVGYTLYKRLVAKKMIKIGDLAPITFTDKAICSLVTVYLL